MNDGFHIFPIQEKKPKNKAKELGREALLELGIDSRIVNLKEEGVSINQFNKVILKVYKKAFEEGYQKGLIKYNSEELTEQKAREMSRFKQTSKMMNQTNQVNVGITKRNY
jgi:hypothetical protein